MLHLFLMTALAGLTATEEAGRSHAAQALELALRESELARQEGGSGRTAVERGLEEAMRVLGPASETAAELERLAQGARFEALLNGDGNGVDWLAAQLPALISDLRFQPVLEAEIPEGFPEWTPVGEIQIQRYPAYRMARASMETPGSNNAFWRLFGHIQGNQIAMTAPVETSYELVDEAWASSSMAFLYGSRELGRPGPQGPVEVVDVPAQVVVSTGLRGFESPERIAQARQRLELWLEAHPEWSAAGPPRSMGYNSPMVAGDRRYFEVQIPVERADRIVVDFGASGEASRWRAVDDVVMGGRSSSRMEASSERASVFTGELSVENNGGFASVRRDLDGPALAGATSLTLRVRGDGKAYQLRLRTGRGFDLPSYQADFETVAGEWMDVTLDLADFELKWRGRPVRQAPPLDPAAVRGLGLLIADEQVGSFRLELASLRQP